jgi:hypothetical protein
MRPKTPFRLGARRTPIRRKPGLSLAEVIISPASSQRPPHLLVTHTASVQIGDPLSRPPVHFVARLAAIK